eukprot:7115676-Pyramimonas_sp.AAC.1
MERVRGVSGRHEGLNPAHAGQKIFLVSPKCRKRRAVQVIGCMCPPPRASSLLLPHSVMGTPSSLA